MKLKLFLILNGEENMGDDWGPRKRRKNRIPFNPNSQFIESAVKDYLKNGGKITRFEANDKDYKTFVENRKDFSSGADEFLRNEG
ncbi:MAG: hypothetical protein ABFQ65_03780 [Nanoarchaeota archaeon]